MVRDHYAISVCLFLQPAHQRAEMMPDISVFTKAFVFLHKVHVKWLISTEFGAVLNLG